jgi:hypothetical protein
MRDDGVTRYHASADDSYVVSSGLMMLLSLGDKKDTVVFMKGLSGLVYCSGNIFVL